METPAKRNHEVTRHDIDPTGRDPYALFTRDEAAAFLRVHRSTISRMTTAGKLQYVRVGRRVLYPRGGLEMYIRGEHDTIYTPDYATGQTSLYQRPEG